MTTRKRILFAGYAPIHFLCCLPVYRRLCGDPRIDFFLSGGFRTKTPDGNTYRQEGFYEPFGIDPSRVRTLEEVKQEDYDVLVSAHLSRELHPRSAAKKVQIFHGVSFKNLLVRPKYMAYDYLCLAGRYHAERYRETGCLKEGNARCLVMGFPKVDPLVDGSLDRKTLLDERGLDSSRPLLLYAPTGSKHNSMETMGPEVIRKIAEEDRWNLVVKLHDHPKRTRVDWAAEVRKLESERVRLLPDLDIIPWLHAADLLLSDASSVTTEYALLDRPMIFLDVPRLFEDVRKRGGALDLDTYGRKVGRVTASPEELPGIVEDALAHPEREAEIRQAMARHVFHLPGTATERVAAVVLHAAGLRESLPEDVMEVPTEASSGVS